ncbi:MAG: N-acetyl-gamma-glutamyl-phosphate reductase [Bacteroidia bacterium]|nr:N-acetyl-gamma-glutamyl-phosphate reductase [Bacteroidia bacterium]
MIKAGIIGGAGYTAGELIRILLFHPEVELVFVHSTSNAGNKLYDVHSGIIGDTEMCFSAEYDLNAVDVLFLCSGHGKSTEFWSQNERPAGLKVIDLAQDYRDEHDGYVYGLPEWQKEKIAGASLVANPGCFATAIQLALFPLASVSKACGPLCVSAITGSTGAGVKPGSTTHFSWRNNNVSIYKVLEHQHTLEINRNLKRYSAPYAFPDVNFIPMRGDFARGIFATVQTECDMDEAAAVKLYKDFYQDAAFTHVSDKAIDLKQVVNTNKAIVHVEKHGNMLVVSSVIDNLLKGASGQAVQNMNIIFGLPEDTGLKLKASAF